MFVLALACAPVEPPELPGPVPVHRGLQDPGIDSDALDALVTRSMAAEGIPGLSLALVDRGGVFWSSAYGWADIDAGLENTPQTPFMLASVSKTVVGAALMAAAEDGLLDLDDPASTHLGFDLVNPLVGAGAPPIRLSHLAAHAAGIRDEFSTLEQDYVDGDTDVALEDFVRSYLVEGGSRYRRRANFYAWEAGESWSYSNVGATAAALAVQGARGAPFDAFCEDRLFEPLGMRDTHWFLRDFPDPDAIARPHLWDGPRFEVREHYGYADWPDGQLRSTAEDLGAFVGMIASGGVWEGERVLREDTVAEALRPPVRGLPGPVVEGVVGFTEQDVFFMRYHLGDRVLVGHGGNDAGVATDIGIDEDSGVGFVLLCNTDEYQGEVVDTLHALESALLDAGIARGGGR
ncbi:MAG: serine hydrolase domain-containing protein [Myxococcota bacterium]